MPYTYSSVAVNHNTIQGADMTRKRVSTQHLVVLYTEKHLTMEEIGRIVGMSRQGVMKRLHAVGVTREDGTRVKRPCAYCGVVVDRPRSQARPRLSAYCSPEHYYASLENPEFQQWRHGGRLARAIVSQHYPLQRDHVVHHIDGNQRNNDLANLQVYASQADHMAVHRGRHVDSVWDGASMPQTAP